MVLEDAAHQVVEFGDADADAAGDEIEKILGSWESHSRLPHEGGTTDQAGALLCRCKGVWFLDDEWGRIHVLELRKRLDEVDTAALEWAAIAIAVALLSQRSAAAQTDDARRSFLSDVLQSRTQAPKQLYHRARNLGAELEGRRLAAIVVGFENLDRLLAERSDTEDDRQSLREMLVDALRAAAPEVGVSILPGLDGDRAIAVVGVGGSAPTAEALHDLGQRVVKRMEHAVVAPACLVGISEEATVLSLRRAFDQATEAFEYGLRFKKPGVYSYADLGVHHLLLKMSESADLARFVESELRPLLDHDARSSVHLLPTLKAYLVSGQNKSVAARMLQIDRRTLYQRLDRIESVLGRPASGHETTFRLALALQALEVLQGRVTPARVPNGRRVMSQSEVFLQ